MNVKKLAKELKKEYRVAFIAHEQLYVMWWSDTQDGWYIEVYNPFDLEEPIDGGLCTGSAKDAIEFML